MDALTPAHRQCPAGEVGVGQVEPGDLHGTHGVDGHQTNDEARGGTIQPVQGPGQSITGQGPRQVYSSRQLQPGRGVEEDQPLLRQGPENTTQHAEQPASHVALMAGEFARDVLCSDLPQVQPGRRPRSQGRPGDAQVATDTPEAAGVCR